MVVFGRPACPHALAADTPLAQNPAQLQAATGHAPTLSPSSSPQLMRPMQHIH